MTNIHSNPTPLRQKFIEYLTLNRKAERTVHTYVSFTYSLARHARRSPDLLGPEDIRQWLYHLIAERKQAASTVNLAINAVRSFYPDSESGLQRDIEPLLHQIKRPRRPTLAPRLYSMAEVEKLLTVGTEGNLRALAFLSCVYGGGLRLSAGRPHGCGDRHCPSCQHQRSRQWLQEQRRALLPVRYFHWVFTLPAALRPLILQNPAPLYRLLFESASATLLQFGQQRFQAELGLTAILHTWGQNLMKARWDATPTAWPSPTAACAPSTPAPAPSPSLTRITPMPTASKP